MTMNDGLSNKDLYQIINRAISSWNRFIDRPVNTEINIFAEKYQQRMATNSQLSFFEETPALPQDLKEAQQFFNKLEDYRLATDIDANDDDISETLCRDVLHGLKKFTPILSPENIQTSEILIQNIKRHLPEYKDDIQLEEYIEEANEIHKRKPKRDSNEKAIEDSSHNAYHFLKRILKGTEIKEIKPCAKKIELYQKSIKVVDCLVSKKYRRTFKFKLKKDLNEEIYKCAESLGAGFVAIAQNAKDEVWRFDRAINNALDFSIRKYGENHWLK